jgi:hypothetical protein
MQWPNEHGQTMIDTTQHRQLKATRTALKSGRGRRVWGYQTETVNRKTDNTIARKKKGKRTNIDLQNVTHKIKNRVTRTPLKSGAPEVSAVTALVTPVW